MECASERRRLLNALNCRGWSWLLGDQQMSDTGYCKQSPHQDGFIQHQVCSLTLSDWQMKVGSWCVTASATQPLCPSPEHSSHCSYPSESSGLTLQRALTLCCFTSAPSSAQTICTCSSPGCGKVVSFFPQKLLSIAYVPLMSLLSPTWIFPHL